MTYKAYKKQALEDLKKYPYLKSSLVTLSQRIDLLKKISASSANSPGQSAVADEIKQLSDTLQTNTIYVSCIEHALSCLPQNEQKLIATYYIHRQRGVVENLSISSYNDRSTVYRRAQKALEHYTLSYFGQAK